MSCWFSICLQLLRCKAVGYSWNSPTCTWQPIWAKLPAKACHVAQSRKQNTVFRNLAPRSEKRRSGVLSFLGIISWRLRYKDTLQCFVKTKWWAAFLSKMAPKRIHKHTGDAKHPVHLQPTGRDSALHSRLYYCPAWHPLTPVTLADFNHLKSSICQQDIHIHIQLFPWPNVSMILRILCTMAI